MNNKLITKEQMKLLIKCGGDCEKPQWSIPCEGCFLRDEAEDQCSIPYIYAKDFDKTESNWRKEKLLVTYNLYIKEYPNEKEQIDSFLFDSII